MIQPTKRSVTVSVMARSGSERKSADESRKLLIDTCIELLADRPIQEVTNRLLEETTGLNRSYITRYFGNRNKMLIAVVRELEGRIANEVATSLAGAGEMDAAALVARPESVMGIQITMWLLSHEVAPDEFIASESLLLKTIAERIEKVFGLGPRTARTFAFQILLTSAGAASIGPTFGLTETDSADIQSLIWAQLAASAATETAMGW